MTEHDWSIPIVGAHKVSANHRDQLQASDTAGCFYCTVVFSPSEIQVWIDEVGGVKTTALCPHCGIDSVIGSASGYPITPEFLRQMRDYWF